MHGPAEPADGPRRDPSDPAPVAPGEPQRVVRPVPCDTRDRHRRCRYTSTIQPREHGRNRSTRRRCETELHEGRAGPPRARRPRRRASRLVHTGQHYDAAMSDVFFSELGLPEPDVNLGVGSGTHAAQTAALHGRARGCSSRRFARASSSSTATSTRPSRAALVAAKTGLPVAHVEAGLRSFDWHDARGGQPAA